MGRERERKGEAERKRERYVCYVIFSLVSEEFYVQMMTRKARIKKTLPCQILREILQSTDFSYLSF